MQSSLLARRVERRVGDAAASVKRVSGCYVAVPSIRSPI